MAEKEQRIRRKCPYCPGRNRGVGLKHSSQRQCTYCWDKGWILVVQTVHYRIQAQVKKRLTMFTQAFQLFMSESFESAVDSSTQASWGGGSYSVELFEDGSYRVLDTNLIGNRYDSPGIILQIPSLNEEEWDDDPSIRYYDNARDNLVNKYDQYVVEALNRSSLENEE